MKIDRSATHCYPAYKDSGVEWLGDVPAAWSIVRNKEIFEERSSLSTTGKETLLTVSHITGVTPRSEKNVNMFMAETMEGYKICRQGDLVINTMWAWMGALGTSNELGICSPAYNVYKPVKGIPYNHKYFDYFFRTPNSIVEMTRNSKGIVSSRLRLYAKDFFKIETVLPSLDEQKSIAHYLDTKTAQIDRKIDLLTQKATKYGQLKRSIINEAVTRGLDRSVVMKDSGIEWIGDVPEHWRLCKLKDIAFYQEGPGIMGDDFKETGIPLIRISGMKGSTVSLEGCNYLDPMKVTKKWSHFQLKQGNLLVSASATTGVVAKVNEDTFGAIPYTGLIRFKPRQGVAIDYLRYLLISDVFTNQIDLQKSGTTIQHYGPTHLGRVFAILPPLSEQKAIAHYLDTKTGQIDQIIQTINTQIEKLKELRKTLINDVVTGKIKVT
ncbi:MAG: restriction endonuclease subunit S [Microcoleaceae cyanobacterium]